MFINFLCHFWFSSTVVCIQLSQKYIHTLTHKILKIPAGKPCCHHILACSMHSQNYILVWLYLAYLVLRAQIKFLSSMDVSFTLVCDEFLMLSHKWRYSPIFQLILGTHYLAVTLFDAAVNSKMSDVFYLISLQWWTGKVLYRISSII